MQRFSEEEGLGLTQMQLLTLEDSVRTRHERGIAEIKRFQFGEIYPSLSISFLTSNLHMGCVIEGTVAKESSLQRGEVYSSRPLHTHTSETEGRRVIKAANTLNPIINHKGREGGKVYGSTTEF